MNGRESHENRHISRGEESDKRKKITRNLKIKREKTIKLFLTFKLTSLKMNESVVSDSLYYLRSACSDLGV